MSATASASPKAVSAAFEPMLAELRQEAVITRRILERVPEAKLTWRPHEKSMTLGQLALHIAAVPGRFPEALKQNVFESPGFIAPQPESKQEILDAFEESVTQAQKYVAGLTPEVATSAWTLQVNGKPVLSAPRVSMLRMVMMNHIYHHRGQLSVYLRLLNVSVPVIYGASADENPFASA